MAMRWRAVGGALLALAIGLGCGGEQLAPVGGGAGGNGGVSFGGGGAGGGVAQHPGEPQPFAVASWMVAKVGQDDPVYDAIDQGTLEMPTDGYLGLSWQAVTPGDSGELIKSSADVYWAVAQLTPPPGQRLMARGDTVASFHAGRWRRQPGDFYHSRRMRVPLGTLAPSGLLAVRALGRRNVPEVELWSTEAELVLNTADVTVPDLVVGSTAERYLGLATLVMVDEAPLQVAAEVLEGERFEPTRITYPALAPGAVTQLSFRLLPKVAPSQADQTVIVKLRVSSPSLLWSYDAEVELGTVAQDARRRVTRRSKVDGSTQYYALMPPADPQPGQQYGLILSLHGAGVEATGQAASYAPKSWAYLAAATNRRPFGFDWEEWGRLDAIETLEHAQATLPIDPLRVHLTGHSMGGHGTWHVGVHFSGRFGVIAPSAGWISFEKYGGPPHPTGPTGRARQASQTLDFVDNLANSSVYIIHGSADDNVPVSHSQEMYQTLLPITPELVYHEEPGVGHWWDLDPNDEGVDCVDWAPMMAVMKARLRDPLPLDFRFVSPSPWINPTHSFVTLRSAASPMENLVVDSSSAGGAVALSTTNVRSMVLDGSALLAAGVSSLTIDGTPQPLWPGAIAVGPQDGKRADQQGPLNQLFHRPFCLVWADHGPDVYPKYAAWLLSWWSVIGNGQGCGLPLSALDGAIAAEHNLVFLGVPPADLPGAPALPIDWDESGATVAGHTFAGAALAFVYPAGEHLHGYFSAPAGAEHLLLRYVPFSSRAGYADYLLWDEGGLAATGFFDASWAVDPAFAEGL